MKFRFGGIFVRFWTIYVIYNNKIFCLLSDKKNFSSQTSFANPILINNIVTNSFFFVSEGLNCPACKKACSECLCPRFPWHTHWWEICIVFRFSKLIVDKCVCIEDMWRIKTTLIFLTDFLKNLTKTLKYNTYITTCTNPALLNIHNVFRR